MRASLWALILSALLGATVKAQQPSFPILTNVLSPIQREDVRTKAEKGNPAAQSLLGLQYQYGDGVPQDYGEAVKWYRKAAEQGDATAQCFLGVYYEEGIGVTQDYAEAVKWCRRAADQGYALAQYEIGHLYYYGHGVQRDYGEAVKWCHKAAEQGLALAQDDLGHCYIEGKGVTQDYGEGVRWCRKAADQGSASAQYNLGVYYNDGTGVTQDHVEAVTWLRKAADKGFAAAQFALGLCYSHGKGVTQDYTEAVKWYRKAAEQGFADAQANLGFCYDHGEGVIEDYAEGVKWYRKAAEQGASRAQYDLGACYADGNGVIRDYVQAYKWFNLAAAQGETEAKNFLPVLERRMPPEQIAEAQRLAREFRPSKASELAPSLPGAMTADAVPTSSGTGFFVTEDGFLVTAAHVVNGATQIRIITHAGLLLARLVKLDAANDIALLKADGHFSALPIVSSRAVKLGNTIATVGFPNIGLQGFAPKLAKGEIASLSGAQDDVRFFQISVPVQPGSSGGALIDDRGNVIGIVAAKLDAATALAARGALPENVNYAVKSSFLLSFLEADPEVNSKVKSPTVKEQKFEDVVKSTEDATVLIVVY